MWQKIEEFLAFRDSEGIANRDKIRERQRIIRRLESTDRSRSFEEAEKTAGEGIFPPGVVLEGDKLIGFGIHIFNEDVYPLQTFEIYFRNCGLAGPLDLAGCSDLIFIDLYHNRIDAIDLAGDTSLRILGIQDNLIRNLDIRDLRSLQGVDAGCNQISELDLSGNPELVECYINDNKFKNIDISNNSKLKYFYCHNNQMEKLDTRANPLLRHLNATGNPMREILTLAPQREEKRPLELYAEGPGTVGLRYNPVYDAQWKETGKWQQAYYAYPENGAAFDGWFDEKGSRANKEPVWEDSYGSSRILTARFSR